MLNISIIIKFRQSEIARRGRAVYKHLSMLWQVRASAVRAFAVGAKHQKTRFVIPLCLVCARFCVRMLFLAIIANLTHCCGFIINLISI